MNNCGYKGIYSCREQWAEPSSNQLKLYMKSAYHAAYVKLSMTRVNNLMIDACAPKFAEILQ